MVDTQHTEVGAQSPADAKSLADDGHLKGSLDNPLDTDTEMRLEY